MPRRSPEDWHRLLEAHGWQDYAGLAKRLDCSIGTVKAGAKRGREWAAAGGVATAGEVATGSIKQPRQVAGSRAAVLFEGLTEAQAAVVLATVDGRTVTEAAAIAGVERKAAGRWLNHDPLVAAAVSDLRAERHLATMSALTSLAQELVGHHSAAAQLARTLIDQAADRLHEEPPPLPTWEMGPEEAAAAVIARKVWHQETRAAVDQAVKAAGLLNASPILATGGYPKTERIEHGGEVQIGLDDVERLLDDVEAGAEVAQRLRLVGDRE